MNDWELMGVRADTLYRYDPQGRMLCTNEPEGQPAPRVFIGQTASGCVARFGQGVPNDLALRVSNLLKNQPPRDPSPIPLSVLDAVRRLIEQQAPITRESGGPAYRFPESLAPGRDVQQVTRDNVEVLREGHRWLYDTLEDWWPCFAIVRDGAAVSICYSSRIGEAAAEAGVDTLPEHRGRGYASAVTAAWGAWIRASGREPLYSTSWDNHSSQRVARRIGLFLFGADATFF